MKVKATTIQPYPGYEAHVCMNLDTDAGGHVSMEKLQESIKAYKLGEGTTMEDITIPGTEEGQTIRLRVIKPAGLPEKAPVIMDIHGGGWVSGGLDIDNYRCISLAESTPCIVVSVEYRLATRELPYPAQLMDCHTAYTWLTRNAGRLGGDPERIGVHGTSAGGNLAAALALYLRNQGEQQPVLTCLVNPALSMEYTASKLQYGFLGQPGPYYNSVETIYVGEPGRPVDYYQMPGYCRDLRGLGPHMIIAAEYDPLRDEALEYAFNLLRQNVPCEIISAPRVTHGYCVVDQPLTRWTHHGIAASFRREFGMEIVDF